MTTKSKNRPHGVTVLSIFFLAGSVICLVAIAGLLLHNSFLEPMWRLNPHARGGFALMGHWAIALLFTVGVSCAAAAVGLWRGRRWGHRVAFVLIAINLIGDFVNVVLGIEPRAIIGVPVALTILLYLGSGRVRLFFK